MSIDTNKSDQIIAARWRVDKMNDHSIWIRCDLPTGEANAVVCHLGANHPSEVSMAIATSIVRDHNSTLGREAAR